MRKPAKIVKERPRVRRRLADDQAMLETQCGFCGKILPSPSQGVDHIETEHPGEYTRA